MIRYDASPPSRRNSCRDMRCLSHTLKQTLSSRERPLAAPAKLRCTLIDSKSQPLNAGIGGTFFVVMCPVTLNQADMLSLASCEEMSALATSKTSLVSSAEPHWGLEETAQCKAGRTEKS